MSSVSSNTPLTKTCRRTSGVSAFAYCRRTCIKDNIAGSDA